MTYYSAATSATSGIDRSNIFSYSVVCEGDIVKQIFNVVKYE